MLEESWRIAREQKAFGRQALYLHLKARAYFSLGHLDKARRDACEGIKISEKFGERAHLAWCHLVLARCNALSNSGDSSHHLAQSTSIAIELGIQPLLDEAGDLELLKVSLGPFSSNMPFAKHHPRWYHFAR